MTKVLALTTDGRISYCTSPPDKRGFGRCNHLAHQEEGQSAEDFISSIDVMLQVQEGEIESNEEIVERFSSETKKSFNENPDWESVIKNEIKNQFEIGKGDSYEKADLKSVTQERITNENGDPVIKLTGVYEFRGKTYNVDLGEIPEVQEDGSIIINGSKFRVLPVLAQFKSGVVKHRDSIVVKKEDGNISFMLKIEDEDNAYIRGEAVPIEEVEKHLRGEASSLTDLQKFDIDNIDKIAFERFPHLADGDISSFYENYEEDDPADISYRKVYTMKDQIRFELDKQFRRMGVTFRTNLAKRSNIQGESDEALNEKYPLFYQKNNTENIKSELLGRSNVQLADNLNPLSAMSQMHKISLTGPGGYNKDKAPVGLRNVHPSHKGVIDSLDLSSGKNLGLTIALSGGEVDKRGFIVKAAQSDRSNISVSDFIPYRNHSEPVRASMAVAQMKQAVQIVGGEDPKPTGHKSDQNWSKISGSKMGVNLQVAYLPMKNNFEDGVIISESAASKMTTIQSTSYNFDEGSKNIPTVGSKVTRGDFIGGEIVKYNGTVKSVSNGKIEVESVFKMGVGDKVAGRHGNKGVVTQVVPDSQMPKVKQEDGTYRPSDIIISPKSVVGRGNLSQIYEVNNGDFNKISKVKLNSGNEVDATAGSQYIMRLNHIAEKKLTAYDSKLVNGEVKGMRLGEMESLLLTTSPERLEVLNYLRTQEVKDTRKNFNSLMKAIGVEITGLDD